MIELIPAAGAPSSSKFSMPPTIFGMKVSRGRPMRAIREHNSRPREVSEISPVWLWSMAWSCSPARSGPPSWRCSTVVLFGCWEAVTAIRPEREPARFFRGSLLASRPSGGRRFAAGWRRDFCRRRSRSSNAASRDVMMIRPLSPSARAAPPLGEDDVLYWRGDVF